MKRLGWTMAALCVVLLGGCKFSFRDPKVDAQVHGIFEQTRQRDYAAVLRQMAPELAAQATAQDMAKVRAYLPEASPIERTEVTTTWSNLNGVQTVVATDDYRYATGHALVQTTLRKSSEAWTLIGFHVQFATEAQLAVKRFWSSGKTLAQWACLAAMLAVVGSMIAALVKVIRTKGLRRKWLWGILSFLGLGLFSLNWTTGAYRVQLLMVELIGSGVVRQGTPFDDWMLTTTLPVGAVLILTGLWANPARARKPKPKMKPPLTLGSDSPTA